MLEKARSSYRTLTGLPTWENTVKERMFHLVDAAGKRLETF
ncbi:hypothetical protein ACFXJ6_37295 [Streptomyces sp. NPDC059218]